MKNNLGVWGRMSISKYKKCRYGGHGGGGDVRIKIQKFIYVYSYVLEQTQTGGEEHRN